MCLMGFPHMCHVSQVVVNYSSSAGPAEEVAHIIEESGGEAITIGADISKPAEVDRSAKQRLSALATVVPQLQSHSFQLIQPGLAQH